jgi:hypothetical protein
LVLTAVFLSASTWRDSMSSSALARSYSARLDAAMRLTSSSISFCSRAPCASISMTAGWRSPSDDFCSASRRMISAY